MLDAEMYSQLINIIADILRQSHLFPFVMDPDNHKNDIKTKSPPAKRLNLVNRDWIISRRLLRQAEYPGALLGRKLTPSEIQSRLIPEPSNSFSSATSFVGDNVLECILGYL